MFKYNIINKPNIEVDTNIIDKILITISNSIELKQNWILNIVFLDDNSIKNLNKQYRNIDKSTDVLSFHYFNDFSNLKDDDIAGEIILSQTKIIEQWKTYWLWIKWEFYKLLIHSILHILWYDHENDEDFVLMQKQEDEIFKTVFD